MSMIDDKLMTDALRSTDPRAKRETAKLALRIKLQLVKQAKIKRLRGKVQWQGDLDAMRRDR